MRSPAFVIAGLDLPGFNPGTKSIRFERFFSMDARVISAFTRVFDALLPAHDDSRGHHDRATEMFCKAGL
jgi:hypothetical protein